GASCTTFAQVGTAASVSFSDSGLTPSTPYHYQVRATDAAANLSGYSNAATATTLAPPDTEAPTAPSALSAAATSPTAIALTWTAATDTVGVTSYLVERCEGANCTTFAPVGPAARVGFSERGPH